jgi:hypothetical protein
MLFACTESKATRTKFASIPNVDFFLFVHSFGISSSESGEDVKPQVIYDGGWGVGDL